MDLLQISSIVKVTGGFVLLLLSLVKIPKLELNVWKWMARGLGRAINGEISQDIKEIKVEVETIKQDLDDHIQKDDERHAKNCRQRILRFNDELLDGKTHTKESFDCTLEDIDNYKHYCDTHPNFLNSKCDFAMKNIEKSYQDCLENKKFN